jgi:hypothetical protein
MENGVDEIALALAADAWSRTYRSSAYSLAAGPTVTTRRGLVIQPDRSPADTPAERRIVLTSNAPPMAALDQALRTLAQLYGAGTANFVALQIEYPRPSPASRE